jgi:hypothetical protein
MMAEFAGGAPGRWRLTVWGVAGLLLLAPMGGMLVTPEMAWGPGDFLLFGGMLLMACAAFELVLRFGRTARARRGMGLLIVALFLLIWVELAVGIFGPG